jgi:hypothetical protein
MARKSDERGSALASGVALGLGIAALLGVGLLIYYLLRRRDTQAALPPASVGASGLGDLDGVVDLMAFKAEPAPARPNPHFSSQSRAASFSLPVSRRGIPVAFGTEYPATARVRATGPGGAIALISYDPTATSPFLLTAGESEDFPLRPRQVLYARASVANMIVSVVMTETLQRD